MPTVPGKAAVPVVFDTSARAARRVPAAKAKDQRAVLYVCGVTPYDATHLGHAATYVAFDTLVRAWRDSGIDVLYVQNTTDIDDPLLERAQQTGVDWAELAASQIDLFREDMNALRVIAPEHYIGAVESIPRVVAAVEALLASGAAYTLENGDVYYRVATPVKPPFGSVSHEDTETMLSLFAERGGDPDTPGKENPLDALLWRAARDGEPRWDGGSLGEGRPGWHIECAVIAQDYAGTPLTVQGGGSDLVFPHHEYCAAHSQSLTGVPFAESYVHAGMVGYQGEKMSKSKGNLVLVSALREQGVDPAAIRLALLSHHYRCDWEFFEDMISFEQRRLNQWRAAVRDGVAGNYVAPVVADDVVADMRAALADDLDGPRALAAVDAWAMAHEGPAEAQAGPEAAEAARLIATAVDALLGVDLLA